MAETYFGKHRIVIIMPLWSTTRFGADGNLHSYTKIQQDARIRRHQQVVDRVNGAWDFKEMPPKKEHDHKARHLNDS